MQQTRGVAQLGRGQGRWAWKLAMLAVLLAAAACGEDPQPDAAVDAAAAADVVDIAGGTDTLAGTDAAVGSDAGDGIDGAAGTDADLGDSAVSVDTEIAGDTEVASETEVILDVAADTTATQDAADATAPADTLDTADAGDSADSIDSSPACGPECAQQDFGSPCLVGSCQAGVCKGVPVAAATSCEDGNPCTSGDTCCLPGNSFCQAGTCKSGKSSCECQGIDPTECENLKGDANLCNGIQMCDTSSMPYKCALKPGSAVVCPSDGGECASYSCQPATGKCVKKAKPDGETCASGSPCADYECAGGECTVATKKCECASSADCAGKNNPNLCAGTYYCDKTSTNWTCKINPATAVYCPSGADTTCAKNVCLPSTGKCQMKPTEWLDCSSGTCTVLATPKQTALCDDGNACTGSDACSGGQCKAGTVICGCQKDADCSAKEDGDPCNGTLYCDLKSGSCKVNPVSVVTCPASSEPCMANLCKNAAGKGVCTITAILEGKPCSDGDLCTSGDHCEKGACTATANTCVCGKDSDCAKFDDGDACNGLMICDLSQVKPVCVVNPATVVSCPESNSVCVVGSCDKASGKCLQSKLADGSECDADGNSCTYGDHCQGGVCKVGTAVCGCQIDSDCQKFDDGNPCNGGLYCDVASKACKVNLASIVQCPTALDGPCQTTSCDPKSGKCAAAAAELGTSCQDGNPCTLGDSCVGGSCVSGAQACGCLNDAGCVAQDDGDPCNGKLICDLAVGKCVTAPGSPVNCTADGNGCTAESCDPKTGNCSSTPVAEGSWCSDGVPCTDGDSCAGGKCQAGVNLCSCKTAQDCNDDGDLCNGVPSCVSGKCQPGKAVVCGGGGASGSCVVQKCAPLLGSCAAAPGQCDDGNPCTADSCDLASGKCLFNPYGNGTVCGANSVCIGGSCKVGPPDTSLIGGIFWMGCNAAVDPQCKADESPQHLVQVAPVAMDRYEVTVDAYAACVKLGKCSSSKEGGGCNAGQAFKQNHPMNCVQQSQAAAYCASKGGRLPSEAEWELAARGPCASPDCKASARRFPWGNLPLPSCLLTWMQGSVGPGCNNGGTQQVGSLPKDQSVWGIFDMGGNVSEWTADGYGAGFYASAEATKLSPKAPLGDQGTFRGGSLQSQAVDIRVSARHALAAGSHGAHLGFRCAYDF